MIFGRNKKDFSVNILNVYKKYYDEKVKNLNY